MCNGAAARRSKAEGRSAARSQIFSRRCCPLHKRSHHLLASTLLKERSGFSARRYEWAFLFGSIQPDCNPFSYLKGSRQAQLLRGHHYANAHPYVCRRIRTLQARQRWSLWQYYTLGKLTHYLADAFTRPHNAGQGDHLLDHHRYERALRLYLADYLAARPVHRSAQTLSRPADLIEALETLHCRYLRHAADVRQDARYALQALELLMEGCRPGIFAVSGGSSAQNL